MDLAPVMADELGSRWRAGDAAREPAVDMESEDGTVLVEIKVRAAGLRELHGAIVRLALAADRPGVDRAVLVLWESRVSEDSLRREWDELVRLFKPKLRATLQLVAVWPDRVSCVPRDALGEELARALRAVASRAAPAHSRKIEKRHEIVKLLVLRWLRGEGPLALNELQRLAGASLPTVSKTIAELERYVARGPGRRVALTSFPAEPWGRLVALAPRIRQTAWFADQSGRAPELQRLAARLARSGRPLALGGVLAARHWDRELDLDGLPRLDVCVHAPDGALDTGFVAQLDPGLAPTSDPSKVALVLHAVPRASSEFAPAGPKALPWADPVETLLDLAELRLTHQADELVRHLRSRPRP